MANHGARQQKKLAKQKAKRTGKRTQLARENSADPSIRLRAAERWPIVDCLVPDDLWTAGIGMLVISREMPDGQIVFANLLVDVFCLGIKNALWHICPRERYLEQVERIEERGKLTRVSPEDFVKLIRDAAAYAQSLGFPPHADFRHARLLLEGIDASRCPDQFTFGSKGKPLYVSGPYDSPEKSRMISRRITEMGGHFILGVNPDSELMLEDGDFDEDDFDEFDDEDFNGDENGDSPPR